MTTFLVGVSTCRSHIFILLPPPSRPLPPASLHLLVFLPCAKERAPFFLLSVFYVLMFDPKIYLTSTVETAKSDFSQDSYKDINETMKENFHTFLSARYSIVPRHLFSFM